MKGLEIKKNKIAIIGFGVSGKSAARYFLKKDVMVDVFDDAQQAKFDMTSISDFISSDLFNIYFQKPIQEIVIGEYDYVVASPGVWLTHPIIQKAKEEGIEYLTDINTFLRIFRKEFPYGKTVSVTGSNGKSTTVSLMYEALKASGADVYLGGNIGTSPLDFFDEIKSDTPIVILETSSYQLEYMKEEDFFDIAAITNISDNHLNRYGGSKETYAKAKLGGIHKEYTDAIVNSDDEDSITYVLPNLPTKNVLPVCFKSHVVTAITLENNSLLYRGEQDKRELVHDVSQMKLVGEHNVYNCAFVCAVFVLLNIEISKTVEGAIYNFSGLIHRVQFVDVVNGVQYINDSKSTSPDATVKALETLGKTKNIILISGGNDKDISYDAMKEGWQDYVEGLVLLPGTANPKLRQLAEQANVEFLGEVQEMTEAVELASKNVQPGGVVLLSPATDSHASFKSFEDRGNQFIECVQKLKR